MPLTWLIVQKLKLIIFLKPLSVNRKPSVEQKKLSYFSTETFQSWRTLAMELFVEELAALSETDAKLTSVVAEMYMDAKLRYLCTSHWQTIIIIITS